MNLKRLEIFIIVIIIALIGIIYAFTQKPVIAPTDENQNQQQQVSTTVFQYPGQDGKTAMDLLKAFHSVEVKSYSFGDMVVGIDGVKPDDKHFWAFYVNGQMSQVGAQQYVTKNSDTIQWQIDEIQN